MLRNADSFCIIQEDVTTRQKYNKNLTISRQESYGWFNSPLIFIIVSKCVSQVFQKKEALKWAYTM